MTAINAVADLTIDGDIGVLTLDSPPVNALSADVRDGLSLGIAAAAACRILKCRPRR
jgi:3-hydroxyacyl-CoA dehydrogenase